MLDHIGLGVSDYPRSRAFYEAALAPLGYGVVLDLGFGIGFGWKGKPSFWLGPEEGAGKSEVHVAFVARDRAAVDAFYAAAIAAGGKDNGKPGLRPEYHETYYGAFVLDPDGNNVEAVCHKP